MPEHNGKKYTERDRIIAVEILKQIVGERYNGYDVGFVASKIFEARLSQPKT